MFDSAISKPQILHTRCIQVQETIPGLVHMKINVFPQNRIQPKWNGFIGKHSNFQREQWKHQWGI